jgi:hypothetical protein
MGDDQVRLPSYSTRVQNRRYYFRPRSRARFGRWSVAGCCNLRGWCRSDRVTTGPEPLLASISTGPAPRYQVPPIGEQQGR